MTIRYSKVVVIFGILTDCNCCTLTYWLTGVRYIPIPGDWSSIFLTISFILGIRVVLTCSTDTFPTGPLPVWWRYIDAIPFVPFWLAFRRYGVRPQWWWHSPFGILILRLNFGIDYRLTGVTIVDATVPRPLADAAIDTDTDLTAFVIRYHHHYGEVLGLMVTWYIQ